MCLKSHSDISPKYNKGEERIRPQVTLDVGCKVQLHVPVVHPGQRPKVGDGQSG